MIECIAAYRAHDGSLHYTKEEAITANTEAMEARLDKSVKHGLKFFTSQHAQVMNYLINNRKFLSKLLGLEDIDPKPCDLKTQ